MREGAAGVFMGGPPNIRRINFGKMGKINDCYDVIRCYQLLSVVISCHQL
jgi:hypothetical protein